MEKVGLQAVIAGMPGFRAASKEIDRSFDHLSAGSERAAGRMSKIGDIAKTAIGFAVGTIAVSAIKSLTSGLVGLVASAAPLKDMEVAFERLADSYDINSGRMMEAMRAASKGTIADSDLIQSANKALIGSGKDLGKQFGEALPRLLEMARASAKATGQDVGFLFESLVTGIKRGSPMIIDNTGLQLKLSEAYQATADAIGITVEEMTAEQKQIALLNATLAAGQDMVAAMGSETLTTTEKMAKLRVMGKNLRDQFAKSLLPILDMFLDILIPIAETLAAKVVPAMERTIVKITDFAVALRSLGIGGVLEKLWERLAPEWLEGALMEMGELLRTLGRYFAFVAEEGDYLNDFLADLPDPLQSTVKALGKFVATAQGVIDAFRELRLGDPSAFFRDLWSAIELSFGKRAATLVVEYTAKMHRLVEAFSELREKDFLGFFRKLRPALENIFGEELIAGIWEPIASDLGFAQERLAELQEMLPGFRTTWTEAMQLVRESAVKTWNEKVIPALDATIDKIGELRDEAGIAFPEMDKLMLATATIVGTAMLYGVLGPLGLALVALRALRWAWEQDWGGIRETTQGVIEETIKPKIDEGIAKLGEWRDSLIEKLAEGKLSLGEHRIAWDEWASGLSEGMGEVELSLAENRSAWDEWYDQLSTQLGELREKWIGPLADAWNLAMSTMTRAWQIFWDGLQPSLAAMLPYLQEWASKDLLPALTEFTQELSDMWLKHLLPAVEEVTKAIRDFLDEHPAVKEALGTVIYLVGRLIGTEVLAALMIALDTVTMLIKGATIAIDILSMAIDVASFAIQAIIKMVDSWIDRINQAVGWIRTLRQIISRGFYINVGVSWPSAPSWLSWLMGRSPPPAVLDVAALNVKLRETGKLLTQLGAAPMWSVPVPAAAPAVGAGVQQVTNIWSPQLTANYPQVQSPGGVTQDLETLAILYRMS